MVRSSGGHGAYSNCDLRFTGMARLEVTASSSVLFLYLGRRGALGRFTLELAEAAQRNTSIRPIFAVSRMNPIAPEFVGRGPLLLLDTFERTFSLETVKNFLALRRCLLETIAAVRPPVAVVTLMPHVWTPLLARSIRSAGAKYVTIIHDAVAHPGDPTAVLTPWLRSEASVADVVVTLSRAVAEQLLGQGRVAGQKLLPLFHPDLSYDGHAGPRERKPDTPFRVLFLGRIMKYKGLSLLVEAIELLKAQGVDVHLGVAGSGDIEDMRSRLAGVRAEVINRWLEDHEIAPLLARYDAIALSHVEASQSGVAATAFGNFVPVIGMPVGGIAEQVIDGKTGVLAKQPTSVAFADAIRRLADDGMFYARIASNLSATRTARSMDEFLQQLLVRLRHVE